MTDQKLNRRAGDGAVNVLATKIERLGEDIGEMKDRITRLSAALGRKLTRLVRWKGAA